MLVRDARTNDDPSCQTIEIFGLVRPMEIAQLPLNALRALAAAEAVDAPHRVDRTRKGISTPIFSPQEQDQPRTRQGRPAQNF
jgi:hypothetical protein